jgi:uncharacterized protein YceK
MNMNFKLKIVAIFLPIICFCGGCSTFVTHGGMPDLGLKTAGIYRGTRENCNIIFHSTQAAPDDLKREAEMAKGFGIIDFPGSLIMDTLVFPYDLATLHSQEPDNSN